jgi:hypothetical protein
VAQTTLVDHYLEEGKSLVEALDAANIPVRAAFWFYDVDAEFWYLIIATPLVDDLGPRGTYTLLQTKLQEVNSSLTLWDIKVMSPDASLIQLLRAAINTGAAIAGIPFSRSAINGVYIEDAYIYRST